MPKEYILEDDHHPLRCLRSIDEYKNRLTTDMTPKELFEFDSGSRRSCPDAINFSLVLMQEWDPTQEWVSGIPG